MHIVNIFLEILMLLQNFDIINNNLLDQLMISF